MEGLVGAAQDAAFDMGIAYAVADVEVPASWGYPITVAEAAASMGRSPAVAAPPGAPTAPNPATPPMLGKQVLPTQPKVFEPGPQVQPMPMELGMADARALLVPLARMVRDQRALARQAHPGTLSRQRRSVRWMAECVVCLRGERIVDDAAHAVRFFASTCRHPGITEMEAQRSDHTLAELAKRQSAQPASFMWMLGDQIYSDARAGLADSASTIERLLPRYRDAFGPKAFRDLARTLPLYMSMDDHEIGDNYSADDLKLDADASLLARNASSAFNAFQRSHGPAALGPQGQDMAFASGGAAFCRLTPGCIASGRWGPSSNAAFCTPSNGPCWSNGCWPSSAVAAASTPNLSSQARCLRRGWCRGLGRLRRAISTPGSWQLVEGERQRLLSFIAQERIDNVVFLSGDYHYSATITFTQSPVRAYALVALLRFANVAASDVLTAETVLLDSGHAQINARAFNGWLECELQSNASGRMVLRSEFRVHAIDAPMPELWSEAWELG